MISRMCAACTLLYSLHGDYVRADSRRLTLLHYSLCDASASIHRHSPHLACVTAKIKIRENVL